MATKSRNFAYAKAVTGKKQKREINRKSVLASHKEQKDRCKGGIA